MFQFLSSALEQAVNFAIYLPFIVNVAFAKMGGKNAWNSIALLTGTFTIPHVGGAQRTILLALEPDFHEDLKGITIGFTYSFLHLSKYTAVLIHTLCCNVLKVSKMFSFFLLGHVSPCGFSQVASLLFTPRCAAFYILLHSHQSRVQSSRSLQISAQNKTSLWLETKSLCCENNHCVRRYGFPFHIQVRIKPNQLRFTSCRWTSGHSLLRIC